MTSSESSQAVDFPRPLTTPEYELARWMLEHSNAEALPFLSQLPLARVVSGCDCGCASVNFEIDGKPKPAGALRILGDYLFGNDSSLCGAFVFEIEGTLAGIEVYGLAVPAPDILPAPRDLRPFQTDGAARPAHDS